MGSIPASKTLDFLRAWPRSHVGAHSETKNFATGGVAAGRSGDDMRDFGRLANRMKIREWIAFITLFVGINSLSTVLAAAQVKAGSVTIRYAAVSPFVALLAGILILIMPRLLNYIVAVYLILIGLIGILGV
jgi:hypothetical protein